MQHARSSKQHTGTLQAPTNPNHQQHELIYCRHNSSIHRSRILSQYADTRAIERMMQALWMCKLMACK
jgi:hypothetical protein